ncbi:MAG: hypothetical protein IKZ82_12340 [Clostridia bacterium]|nr:hypothetical protein [Clostridia bacterium]
MLRLTSHFPLAAEAPAEGRPEKNASIDFAFFFDSNLFQIPNGICAGVHLIRLRGALLRLSHLLLEEKAYGFAFPARRGGSCGGRPEKNDSIDFVFFSLLIEIPKEFPPQLAQRISLAKQISPAEGRFHSAKPNLIYSTLPPQTP